MDNNLHKSNNDTIKLSLADMHPIISECLERNQSVVFTVTGISMQPMVYHLKDQVIFTKPKLPLKKYDVALYKMNNGKYIMHRVIKCYPDGSYKFRGDNNWTCEDRVQPNQIIAVVRSFIRNGKTIDINKSFMYWLYARLWKYLRWLKIFIKKF